jgi:hypothetical protein
MRRLLWIPLVLSGCPTPYIPSGTTDTDATTDEGATTDTDVEETDVESDPPDTFDTSLVPHDTDTTGMPSNLQDLDCHPWDPMSYDGWMRKYRYKGPGGGFGTETHRAAGWADLPDIQAVVTAGNSWTVELTGMGASQNYTATYWSTCTGRSGNGEAHSVAYEITSGGKTLTAGAVDGEEYLPEEVEFWAQFAPSWILDTKYKLKVPVGRNPTVPSCPTTANGWRTVKATYTGLGFEQGDFGPLHNVDAYKINVVLDQTQVVNKSFCQQFNIFALFTQAFAQAFGGVAQSEDGGFVTASIDRWYVRGVGLVKEVAVDYTTHAELYSKTLTDCSGLPECP